MRKDNVYWMMIMVLLCSVNIQVLRSQEGTSGRMHVNLKCEHLIAPLGIDRQRPRFSWLLNDDKEGAKQTAYKITVGKDSVALTKDRKIVWQEEKKNGETMTCYKGKVLEPFTKYYWGITVWDKDKQKSRKVISSLETGKLEP